MKTTDYFKIVSTNNNTLYFKLKGFWSDIAIGPLQDEIFEAWQTAVESYGGQQFITIPNLTDFKTARDKGKALIAKMMKFAQDNNLYHSIQIMPEAIARITISQPVSEVELQNFRSVVMTLEQANELAKIKLEEIRTINRVASH